MDMYSVPRMYLGILGPSNLPGSVNEAKGIGGRDRKARRDERSIDPTTFDRDNPPKYGMSIDPQSLGLLRKDWPYVATIVRDELIVPPIDGAFGTFLIRAAGSTGEPMECVIRWKWATN